MLHENKCIITRK